MKTFKLLDDLEFHSDQPYAQPLLVDQNSRILRFMLRPGQSIDEHRAPTSPFYAVILAGRGVFTGPDATEVEIEPNDLLIFDQDEPHSVRALEEDLIFLGFLREVSSAKQEAGGVIGREG